MPDAPASADETNASPGETGRMIVLFDGECVLCNGWARLIAARDPKCQFTLGTLQSATGARLLAEHALAADMSSIVLLEPGGGMATKSDAILGIASRLSAPWPLVTVFFAVPRVVRDWVYDFIAARRYRWFGKSEHCPTPAASLRARLLP